MNRVAPLRRAATLAAAAILTLPLHAQAGWQQDDALVGHAVDASVVLHEARSPVRGDVRDNLALFGGGGMPTVVIVTTSRSRWSKSDLRTEAKRLKKVDKLARSWRKAGIETVLLTPRPYTTGKPFDLLGRARLKSTIHAYLHWNGRAERSGAATLQDTLFRATFTEQLEFRWFRLGALGTIDASGADILADAKRASARAHEDGASIDEDLAQWHLQDACADDPDRVDAAIAHFRDVFVTPHVDRGYLPEAVDALRRVAAWIGDAPCAAAQKVRADLESLPASDGYDTLEAAHSALERILAAEAEARRAVDTTYEDLLRRSGSDGYDKEAYARALHDHLPEIVRALDDFLASFGETPYRRDASIVLAEIREELADAPVPPR